MIGCSRSLTDVFLLMRNNALQTRHLLSEQSMSDHVRLLRDESASVSLHGVDLESGRGFAGKGGGAPGNGVCLPPAWADSLEEAQYIISRLRTKLTELQQVHDRHLQRPTLDDSCVEEQQAGRLTSEISRHFATAHRIAQSIKEQSRHGSPLEQRLTCNVLSSLVMTLQDLSLNFRTSQNNYLKSLTSRENRANAFFELPNFDDLDVADVTMPKFTADYTHRAGSSSSAQPKNNMNSSAFFEEEEEQDIDEVFQKPANQRMTQQQLLSYERDNTELSLHREQEVNKIVTSIVELNDIFKDLAHMVRDQGTVLDRIDYNIEQTQVSVYDGYKQLQKADSYQRKNRKMHCIFILGMTVTILLVLLVIVKA